MVRYRRPIRTPYERAQRYQSARRIQSAIRRRLAILERRRRARAALLANYERRHPTIRAWYGPRGNNPMASPPRQRGPNRLTTPGRIPPGHPNMQLRQILHTHGTTSGGRSEPITISGSSRVRQGQLSITEALNNAARFIHGTGQSSRRNNWGL